MGGRTRRREAEEDLLNRAAIVTPSDRDLAVITLHDLHIEIGHHTTEIGTRWTVSPRARFELLDLLHEENHRRAECTP